MPDTADIDFSFKPQGNQTVVTWSMSGEREFVKKCVCLAFNMEKLVGDSYKEGLENMKAVVESRHRRNRGPSVAACSFARKA